MSEAWIIILLLFVGAYAGFLLNADYPRKQEVQRWRDILMLTVFIVMALVSAYFLWFGRD